MSILSSQLLRGHCKNLIKKYQPIRGKMHKGAYEGDGKTTVTILNRDAEYGLMIDGISIYGFKLNIGIYVVGPMIIFPKTVLGWNIGSSSDINRDSLSLFKVMVPRPDIIILGLDKSYPRDTPLLTDFKNIMKELNINSEILPVDKACTTFNFLNAEMRFVVGAFLPPNECDSISLERLQEISVRRALNEPIRGKDD
ncbi:hypothetical protein PV328_000930 [Microctonus aethiopoides]|uniref:NADH dehydrogenase [ubiquinone] 1 alpha subcomplex assembly factor 3 n=1 Tax=Microctonus aethiopoides TaxID=144406 RepID=A0AA39FVW7_9HYME|nr:hypothetical protein PV328_000930 [Microctonus aethiopoides]